jgi:tRNA threonylcarbamoyladenosine biosynthesis protein TsaE
MSFRAYTSIILISIVATALCAVEWPERAGELLPPPDLEITLGFEGEGRHARLEARSVAGEDWLSSSRCSP